MTKIFTPLFLLIILLLPGTVAKADNGTATELSGATRVWDEFVSALRTGDMPEAYARLSRDSREKLSYRDFCVEWHPVGIKYNTILSNPGYSDFTIYGSIAAVKIGLDPSLNNSTHDFIRIVLEKDTTDWYIVDEKVQENAICQASVTGVLRDTLKQSKVLDSAFKTGRGNFEDITRELPRIFSSERGKLALQNYTFELDLLRNGVLRATPRNRNNKQGYQITQNGVISSFIPSKKELITAEELTARRKEQQRLKLQKQRQQLQPQPAVIRSRQKSTPKIKTVPAVNITTPSPANLPDLPPDFPMDFNRLKDTPPTKVQSKRLKFLETEESFDLPDIGKLEQIVNSNPPPEKDTVNSTPK